MIKELTHLANHLDKKGLRKEADLLDGVIMKLSSGGGAMESLWNMLQKGRAWKEGWDHGDDERVDPNDENPYGDLTIVTDDEMKKNIVLEKVQSLLDVHQMSKDDLIKALVETSDGPYAKQIKNNTGSTPTLPTNL